MDPSVTMDIDQGNFWVNLPHIVKAIAAATYVAVDPEMTGIKSLDIAKSPVLGMNEIYNQAKSNAKGFHILQFGLTCIQYDPSVKGELECLDLSPVSTTV